MKSKGFTLAETIFSIFISMLVILILQNLLTNLKTVNKSSHRTDDIAFAYVQFNRFLHEDSGVVYALADSSNSFKSKLVKVKGSGKKKIEKTYILEKYKHMIRSTTDEGGHMPLLLNVQAASFSTKDGQIKITVIEKDKRKSELYFKLDPRPKEKSKKDEENKSQSENTTRKNKNSQSKRSSK
ncbi:competence type IV pilus minor pilin ComGF [Lactobacillus sp. LL6]|uniref:competence type IV pilus minor pilin ComGF n=1 Tax=Lactobacillus sp. LL6 TaxID=2596827 RepID=UPI001642FA42|nr:competence type IV pilus minor pilin ComGF [Lactobacillus sp. LL6]